jgi:hypothetical protein
MQHDECRNTLQFRYAGQNLGIQSSSPNFPGFSTFLNLMMNLWYKEIKDAQQADIENCCGGDRFSKIGKSFVHYKSDFV